MQIRITDMPAEGMHLAERVAVDQFPDLLALAGQGTCRIQTPIEVTIFISPVAGMFRVDGSLRTVVGLTCSRCLAAFEDTLASRFRVTYTRQLPEVDDQFSEARELTAEEMGLVPFEGESIDLQATLQEQVILALPMQPLCRSDCRGLCARCGANLNQGGCDCAADTVDPRLAVLKQLKLKE
ncbi:MAG: DUF177 domain-containing protein [Desulfobacterales bacterium]|nr:DUF177 domain-containing protein [Desulfobacterales bacterium]